jgi:hypothetical protein
MELFQALSKHTLNLSTYYLGNIRDTYYFIDIRHKSENIILNRSFWNIKQLNSMHIYKHRNFVPYQEKSYSGNLALQCIDFPSVLNKVCSYIYRSSKNRHLNKLSKDYCRLCKNLVNNFYMILSGNQ